MSLFIDPILNNIEIIKKLKVSAIEIHTGSYANSLKSKENIYLKEIKEVVRLASSEKIKVSAGHGLTFDKVKKIVSIPGIEELNIGHFIIGEAIFYGLENVKLRVQKKQL